MKAQSSHDVVMERTRRAMALKAEGKSQTEIAKEMGLSTNTLNYYLYTVAKTLTGSAKVTERIRQHGQRRGVVSVLGSTVNGKSHDDWFVAGWVAAYATAKGLDPKVLIEDANRILEGKSHE